MLNDHIIISNHDRWGACKWTMEINIKAIAEHAGRRWTDVYTGKMHTDYPVPRAKKLLRMILEYGTLEDLNKVSLYIKGNKKLSEFWDQIRRTDNEKTDN